MGGWVDLAVLGGIALLLCDVLVNHVTVRVLGPENTRCVGDAHATTTCVSIMTHYHSCQGYLVSSIWETAMCHQDDRQLALTSASAKSGEVF